MKLLKISVLCLLSTVVIGSCIKQKYTSPPDTTTLDPNLPVNASLLSLANQAFSMNSGQYRVLGDTTVYGIVIADDKSGNFYKQIVIQDSTGGIAITLDKTTVYGDYPIGRKVYVKLKGLLLMNYAGLPEITYSVNSLGKTTGIPSSLIGNYIIKASYPNTVTPKEFTADDLTSTNLQPYYNTLIKIDNMQFGVTFLGKIYAASTLTGAFASSDTITSCNHLVNLVMYNSSFATFQPYLLPTGNGPVTTVLSNYNGSVQLLIRDTSDVQFTGPRCP